MPLALVREPEARPSSSGATTAARRRCPISHPPVPRGPARRQVPDRGLLQRAPMRPLRTRSSGRNAGRPDVEVRTLIPNIELRLAIPLARATNPTLARTVRATSSSTRPRLQRGLASRPGPSTNCATASSSNRCSPASRPARPLEHDRDRLLQGPPRALVAAFFTASIWAGPLQDPTDDTNRKPMTVTALRSTPENQFRECPTWARPHDTSRQYTDVLAKILRGSLHRRDFARLPARKSGSSPRRSKKPCATSRTRFRATLREELKKASGMPTLRNFGYLGL